ncbi:cyclin-I-like [Actinia tenebrosa]|uniref:Cyclin-I-like n=1 Tax=Actinia tenebrosa TaxID=6105 RepID=A0A6P8H9D7_ACTTE|nr:cyclin-I-like [Actinia tenebrosa]XP_031549352.1 cyclin-I-like [Actinia tenebrosa]
MKVPGGLNAQRLIAVLEDGLLREEKYQPNLKCLAGRKDYDEISFFHRNKMASLLLHLNRHCSFHPETFALAVNLLDRFLTVVKANPKYLPCITISCLFLAAKIVEEDEAIPTAGDLITVSGLKCTPSDLLRMERIILNKLGWNLNAITPLYFLQVFHALCVSKGYLNHCNVLQHLQHITLKLEELLCNHYFTFLKPSTLALALLSNEISFITDNWADATIMLQEMAKTSESELNDARISIMDIGDSVVSIDQCFQMFLVSPEDSQDLSISQNSHKMIQEGKKTNKANVIKVSIKTV